MHFKSIDLKTANCTSFCISIKYTCSCQVLSGLSNLDVSICLMKYLLSKKRSFDTDINVINKWKADMDPNVT